MNKTVFDYEAREYVETDKPSTTWLKSYEYRGHDDVTDHRIMVLEAP